MNVMPLEGTQTVLLLIFYSQ